MGLIGSAVGSGMKLATTIYGGIKNAKAYKDVIGSLRSQQQDNQDWFDRRYNEDATQRADAQALLTQTEERIRNRNKQAAGTAAVMGGTEESVAAAKAANNQALVDATIKIAAAADSRKDNIENQYLATKANLNAQVNDMQLKKAEATAEAVKGAGEAASSMANMF